jgi:6-phosphogluconate dehydrogenase
MVHNGIEYGDMQLIAEVYDVLKNILLMTNEEMAATFDSWNKGELNSYLIEITSKVLRKQDDKTGSGYVVDYIMDKTGSKGTGKWTVEEGAEKGVAIPTISAALDARYLSAHKDDRLKMSEIYHSPDKLSFDKDQVISDLHDALYASKVCSYAQGFSLIKAASDEYEWNIDLSECARLWTGGCIIRAAPLLDDIQKAFTRKKDLSNLLLDGVFAMKLNSKLLAWRRLVALCVTNGIACLSLSNSLAYLETLRRSNLPANLTQAQRDFFGGHTYQRTDDTNEMTRYHTAWTATHKDIGDASKRTAGEQVQT